MMGNFARSAAPPWAITLWCDNTHVYAEFIAKEGPPLVIKHPKTLNGFQKLLTFANSRFEIEQPKGGYYQIPTPVVSKNKPGKVQVGTNSQREEARLLLKKMGMLP